MMHAWEKGFDVNLDGRGPRTVSSTHQAADYLLHRWPVKKGKAYMRAKFACLYALEGNESDEVARRAFIDAADEADIAIRN